MSSLPPTFLIPFPFPTCLNLSATLSSGQTFRWRRDRRGIWWGVVENTVVALWQQEDEPDSPLYAQTFPVPNQWEILRDYFRLDVDLEALYADWIRAEPRITEAIAAFRGLRILRQPPRETFFGFQCATCNTVIKIERSVHKLAQRYGTRIEIGEERLRDEGSDEMNFFAGWRSACQGINSLSGGPAAQCPSDTNSLPQPFDFYAFPTLDALANADEAALRADLWGYRAPRVISLARHLLTYPPGWLESLREVPYAEAHAALTELHGIGAKVADCICLFALDKDEATPIDTHIRQIAVRLDLSDSANKSLTPRVYKLLSDAYRERFGPFAGWAQQYLFFAELHRSRA